MDRKRSLVAVAALAAGLTVAWLMLANDVREFDGADVALVLAVGWSFVAGGLVAWQLHPGNPIGRVMVNHGGGGLRSDPLTSARHRGDRHPERDREGVGRAT